MKTKAYAIEFLKRGAMFGGFGPIVAAIVFFIIDLTAGEIAIDGSELLLAMTSTYLLAFIQAGASIFNQIEHWPIAKSLGIHFSTLFAAYSLCYIANSWIPFEPAVLLIFFGAFTLTYLIIWLSVYLTVKGTKRSFNEQLAKRDGTDNI